MNSKDFEVARGILGDDIAAHKLLVLRDLVDSTFHKLIIGHSPESMSPNHDNAKCPLISDTILLDKFPFVSADEMQAAIEVIISKVMIHKLVQLNLKQRMTDEEGYEVIGSAIDGLRSAIWVIDSLNKRTPEKANA